MNVLNSVLSGNDSLPVSVPQLKEACRLLTQSVEENKEKHAQMMSENKGSLKEYNRQSKTVYEKWELCREQLDGFMEECAFAARLDSMFAHKMIKLDTFEEYQMRVMVEWCLEAARSDDLSMVAFTVNQHDFTIRGAFLNLVTALQSVQSVGAIGRLYCVMHIDVHRGRLETLPQAAALFLSECRLLSVLLPDSKDISRTAASFLQVHINTVMEELNDLREHGGAVHLESANFDHIMKRPFYQVLSQMERLKQTTSFMCDFRSGAGDRWLSDVQQRMCILLMRQLCECCWVTIMNFRGGIAKDCIVDLKALLSNILSFYDIDDIIVGRLKSIAGLCELSLLQWTNAWRKGTYRQYLSNEDFAALAHLFFADSAMRAAFLKELASVDDYSEEEDFE